MADIYDLVVVGGGASGLVSAISAAQSNPRLKILILEAQDQPGRKILASGNGRCNLSHLDAGPENFQENLFTRSLLAKISSEGLQYFFDALGLYTMIDEEGRIYPLSNQASTVLAILKEVIEKHDIEIKTNSPVIRLIKLNDIWSLIFLSGENIKSKRVILATGGLAAPQLGGSRAGYKIAARLGLPIIPVVPALSPLVLAEQGICQQLKGLRFRAAARLLQKDNNEETRGNDEIVSDFETVETYGNTSFDDSRAETISALPDNWKIVRQSTGEFLLTDYGISGIAAMELSEAVASYCLIDEEEGPVLPVKRAKLRPVKDWYALYEKQEFALELDLLPGYSDREIEAGLWQRLSSLPPEKRDRILAGMLPLDLAEYLGREIVRKVASVLENKQAAKPAGQSPVMSDFAGSVLQSNTERHVCDNSDSGFTVKEQNFDDACFINTTLAALRSWRLKVIGVRGFEQAQASLGGLDTASVNPHTMEVYNLPGLYVTGELLDVLGETGGYNLHFAFASGIAAGEAAAEKLTAGG